MRHTQKPPKAAGKILRETPKPELQPAVKGNKEKAADATKRPDANH